MKIIRVLDYLDVDPLFNVDSCSLIAMAGKPTEYPVDLTKISGKLPEKNIRLNYANDYLTFNQKPYQPPIINDEKSPYHKDLLSGACIYPRTFWFIEFIQGKFGINPEQPSIKSLILPNSKLPWKKVVIKGEVENKFIFATLTGKCVLPFKVNFLPIVLPITKGELSFQISKVRDLRNNGDFKMAEWLDAVEVEWKKNATKTSLKSYPNPVDYVNYHNKLTLQRQDRRYYIVYTASGTNIAAAVIDTKDIPAFKVDGVKISSNGFVADYKTFWFSTNDQNEAYYLVAILNSETLDKMIKPHQPRGKFGPRDITRLPFEFNIPKFDNENELHNKISYQGRKASEEVVELPRMSRKKLKFAIPSMKEINKLISELLEG